MERGHARHRSEQFAGATHPPYLARFDHPQRLPHDPFAHDRDQYLAQSSYNGEPRQNGSRAWNELQQADIRPASSTTLPPPTLINPLLHNSSDVAKSPMPPLFDTSRRRSLGGAIGAAIPSQFSPSGVRSIWSSDEDSHGLGRADQSNGSLIQRTMPPPSPPTAGFSNHASAPLGPPAASPFAGIRDLANSSSARRSGGGMSISSILGGVADEHKFMQPPSPGRARASSMREPYTTDGFRERSPKAPRSAAAAIDPGRAVLGRMRDETNDASQGANGFPAFVPPHSNNYSTDGIPGRPSSQPTEQQPPPSLLSEMSHKSDETHMGKLPTFRSYPNTADTYGDRTIRNGWATADRSAFSSPGANKEHRDVFSPAYATKEAASARDERAGLFRPAFQESIESGPTAGRDTPPPPPQYMSGPRNVSERPLTYEEHQRSEAAGARYELQRKDSDPRSLFNISPELRRRGRDSPLPQAVQGAQPRHIGPGGDHPGIKSEFGRMFSGLGSGVGSATPVAGQSMNNGTPTRIISPTRVHDGLELSLDEHDRERSGSARPRKHGIRRSRDDLEPEKYDGRMTPSLSQRGVKKSKTAHQSLHHHHHHHHHTTHHHHHHEGADQQAGTYGMIRFPSNPSAPPTHRHHHHHHHHAHGSLHHHTTTQAKRPEVVVHNEAVLDSVASKPRKHLGSMPYKAVASEPSERLSSDQYLLYATTADLLPKFEGKENCTFTIRVPRWYVSRSAAEVQAGEPGRLEEICRSRRLWGTDIYTDDSDVIAAAVHSGWLKGDFGYANESIGAVDSVDDDAHKTDFQPQLLSKPSYPAPIAAGRDVHITILILPPLGQYAGTHRNHIWSRNWSDSEPHDGMSFMIHKIEFLNAGEADRGVGRNASSRKARITQEQSRRSEAAAALLMLS